MGGPPPIKFYCGIHLTARVCENFNLLGEGKIKPVIAKKFPIPEAAKANDLPEKRQVIGNVVSAGIGTVVTA